MSANFGSAAPIIRVENIAASTTYYLKTLGFSLDWDDGGMVSVSRGDCTMLLTEWDQGQRGTWVWIGVADCRGLYEELVNRDARIRQEPTNFPWACEMQVEDLDGNVLRLGSGPIEGEPFGEFLDAKGKLWKI